MKSPELFQGEKYINTNENYFESWYFKNINNENGISFIPGININEQEKKAFIQVITNDSSYFINYNINDFKYSFSPFYVKIGNNFFSKDNIHIDINDKSQNLVVTGDIKSNCTDGLKLSAPVKGKMNKDIFESISASITVTLKKDNIVIFSDTSANCGLEIVQ